MSEFKNILVINFGGIGDEILFLPTLSSLKKEFPNSKITLCLEPRSAGIKDLTDTIDEVLKIDIKGAHKFRELLKLLINSWKNRYDIAISTGTNKFIPILLFLTGAKKRYGYKNKTSGTVLGEILGKIFLTSAVELNKDQYAANMYHDLLSPISNLKVTLPAIKIEDAEPKIPNSVLIHPGVSKLSVQKNIIKTFDADKWAEIINKLLEYGKDVYLVGAKDDEEIINNILKLTNTNHLHFHNLYGTTKNLMDLAKLIQKSEVLICSDSAPMHVGVGVNTKTIAVFGATDEKKLLPNCEAQKDISDDFIAATNKNCQCRPCLWHIRQTTCEKLTCLDIDVDEIVKKVVE